MIKFHKLNLADKNVEPIPSLFQDIIERMISSQVMTVKPDACIVDFYNEVDALFCFLFVGGFILVSNLLRQPDIATVYRVIIHSPTIGHIGLEGLSIFSSWQNVKWLLGEWFPQTILGIIGALSSFLLSLGNARYRCLFCMIMLPISAF